MATSVNASLASLDTLHSAASSLDTKLQRSLQQQVRTPKGRKRIHLSLPNTFVTADEVCCEIRPQLIPEL